MATKQATTVIGNYKFCPYCGVPDPFQLSVDWPHGKCRECGKFLSDPRLIVAVPILLHQGKVCVGTRGRGFRQGFLNLPGGFVEEHTDGEAVQAANFNRGVRLGFDNQVDGETIPEAAERELREETGYCGPKLRARIICDRLATSMHERLVFVELLAMTDDSGDIADWFSLDHVRTPSELNDIRWVSLTDLPPVEEWAFPIFHAVLSEISAEKL